MDRVLMDPNIPNELKGMYAHYAVADAAAREKADKEAREVRMKHDLEVKEASAAKEAEIKERQEREAEEKGKKDRERFEASLKQEFLERNPGYDVLDWDRNKKQIIDEKLRARASGQQVEFEKQRLLATGRYGF